MDRENKYARITDNGGGKGQIYHNEIGKVYTFPPKYRNALIKGTKVVYHKGDRENLSSSSSIADRSHYFGTAEIGEIKETECGNFEACIENYQQFENIVPIQDENGNYYEGGPNVFQPGVRTIDEKTYESIVEASKHSHSTNNNLHRAKTFENIQSVITSNTFNNGRSSIVTDSNKTLYLLNNGTKIYYELAKINEVNLNEGMRVYKSPNGNVFSITQSGVEIGKLEAIDRGFIFSTSLTTVNNRIKVNI